MKTRYFKKLQNLFPLGSRLLFILQLHVEQPGYIGPVIESTPHFQKSLLVFTQPGSETEVQVFLILAFGVVPSSTQRRPLAINGILLDGVCQKQSNSGGRNNFISITKFPDLLNE